MKHATQRLLSLAIGIVLVIGALIFFFNLVQPAYGEAQALKAQKISQDNFFANQQDTLKQVQAVVAAYQGNANPQVLTNLALPPTKDEADLLNQVSVLSQKYQLAVQAITITTPGAKSTRTQTGQPTTATAASLVKPIGVLNLQMRVSSSYANFRAFLTSLESNIRIMDVLGLVVTPVGKSNQDYYMFDLSVAAYYQNP
jgi:hypothetical protein